MFEAASLRHLRMVVMFVLVSIPLLFLVAHRDYVYPDTYSGPSSMPETCAVVFDFDETLGCFVQFSEVIEALEAVHKRSFGPEDYAAVLRSNALPRYVRPGMLSLLKELGHIKRSREWGANRCRVLIYTNNSGGRKWVRSVARAFEILIDEPGLFDRIICAYSTPEEGRIEKCRTSHEKKYADFLACTRYSRKTRVVFVDDLMHQGMLHPNVSYVHIAPYRWSYSRAQIINACARNKFIDTSRESLVTISEFVLSRPSTAPTDERMAAVRDYHTRLCVKLRGFVRETARDVLGPERGLDQRKWRNRKNAMRYNGGVSTNIRLA